MKTTRYLFHNAHIYGIHRDWYPGWIATEGNRIHLLGAGTPPDFPQGTFDAVINVLGKTLLPGFIDIHVHGAVGQEAMDANPEGLQKMARFYAQHGVTSFVPTTWTAPKSAITEVIRVVEKMIGEVQGGATILGIHLEGPYINATRSGAQDPGLILKADDKDALAFLESGIVKIMVLAPEFPENLWLIDECVRRGVIVSVGHSAATFEEIQTAVQHGLRHATHTYNAMTAFGHRELGTVGAVMFFPEICCELISDDIHVHPGAQKILIDTKGLAGVILVSDAIRGTGSPDGDYPIDTRIITIKDGVARLPGGILAGSTLTMEKALKNVLQASKRTLAEVWPLSSLNAAREIGVSALKGSLEVGKDADIVMIDDDFSVLLTMANGKIIYRV